MLRYIIDNIKLLFCKERELYIYYKNFLGFSISNAKYYNEAFTHRSSIVKDDKGNIINNERLEFLGDAILNAIVSDILYKQFPSKKEGFLTSTRAKIVKRDNLNAVGINLGIDKMVKFANHSQVHNSYICGNTLEALIAAIYLDKGYRECKKFIVKNIIPADNIINAVQTEVNYKSKLIEWTQQNKVTIKFPLIDSTVDLHHSPIFTSAVILNDIIASTENGYSKKESHQNAAKIAYLRLENDNNFKEQILSASINK